MNISVIIPTYKRINDLERCLNAFKTQSKPATQLIVTIRDSDTKSWEFCQHYDFETLPIELVSINVPGVVAALNHGLEGVSGDILAITDDDAEPDPDWLEKIEHHFLSNPQLGALGGKDRLYINGKQQEGKRQVVGKLQWFGRAIGNHSQGIGEVREVDLLKGVNMSFRTQAIGNLKFDERMLGQGAQVHFEMSFCLAIKRAGWKVMYDPNLQVNHFRAPRHDEDQREFHPTASFNQVFNETLVLLDHLSGIQRICFLIWAIAIGTRGARGIVQTIRFLPSEGSQAIHQWIVAMKGRWQAWSYAQKHSFIPLATQFTES